MQFYGQSLGMASLLTAVVLLFLTVDSVGGRRCYQCYGTSAQCFNPAAGNMTGVYTVQCSTPCQTSVMLQSDKSVFLFSRSCAADNSTISCCQNLNSQVKCTEICDDEDLCNNHIYNDTAPINFLSRCSPTAQPGNNLCNSCMYIGYSGDGADTSCVFDPYSSKVGVVQCPTATSECTIKSLRSASNLSFIWTYERSCSIKGSLVNYGRVDDSAYVTWICRCNTTYCNDNTEDGRQADCHPKSSVISLAFSFVHRGRYDAVIVGSFTVALFSLIMLNRLDICNF